MREWAVERKEARGKGAGVVSCVFGEEETTKGYGMREGTAERLLKGRGDGFFVEVEGFETRVVLLQRNRTRTEKINGRTKDSAIPLVPAHPTFSRSGPTRSALCSA